MQLASVSLHAELCCNGCPLAQLYVFQRLLPFSSALCCVLLVQMVEQELQRIPAHIARHYAQQLWSILYIPQVHNTPFDMVLCATTVCASNSTAVMTWVQTVSIVSVLYHANGTCGTSVL